MFACCMVQYGLISLSQEIRSIFAIHMTSLNKPGSQRKWSHTELWKINWYITITHWIKNENKRAFQISFFEITFSGI